MSKSSLKNFGFTMFRSRPFFIYLLFFSIVIFYILASKFSPMYLYAQVTETNLTPRFVSPRFVHSLENSNETDIDSISGIVSSSNSHVQTDLSPIANTNSSVLPLEIRDTIESRGVTAVSSNKTRPDEKEEIATQVPYDIYKENGYYFVDWEKPEIVLVFTGMTNGYIEPCGCAGMDRMKGGLSRRHTFVKQLRCDKGWNVIAIDTGQITTGFGVQEELKFDMAVNAFNLMNYDVIGLGKGELRFPAYFLLTFTAPTSSNSQSLFTSANIGVYGFHSTYTLPYKVIERNGKRIGVASVIFVDQTTERRDENLLYADPEKKLLELVPKIKEEKCDEWILIVHGTKEDSLKLAEKFPFFKYIVTADTPSEPPAELHSTESGQAIIEVGEKGKYAVVIGLYRDGSTRYQRVALDSRFKSSPEVLLLMKDYQSILRALIVSQGFRDGLGITPVRSPQSELLGKYVGAQKCRSCHEDSYRIWGKTRHANAWKSLKETAIPPRDFDPECISCHVVGWDGLQHFPYIDGYSSEKETPDLINVGCECCHGAGEFHIVAELGNDEKLQKRIRTGMHLGSNVKKVCYQCHDGDNSPSFDFETYFPLIDHKKIVEDE